MLQEHMLKAMKGNTAVCSCTCSNLKMAGLCSVYLGPKYLNLFYGHLRQRSNMNLYVVVRHALTTDWSKNLRCNKCRRLRQRHSG